MNVYAVIATSQSSITPIRQNVESAFFENYIQAGEMCWLVADPLDVRTVSKKLGVWEPNSGLAANSPGVISNVIVIWAISYWGSTDTNIWAWIAQKVQQPAPPQPVK